MKKIKSSVLGELPQLMEDLRRHYIPYIDDLCRFRGETRRSVATLFMFSQKSINLPSVWWARKRERKSFPKRIENSPEQLLPARPSRYIFYSVLEEFSLFSPLLSSFSLCRGSVSYRRIRLKTRVTLARLNGILT